MEARRRRRDARLVTSANVACGFHAGDPSTMRRVCQAAAEHGVAIGAQVSYPDLSGFGRRFIDIDPVELRDVVLYQLGALDGFAQVAGAGVTYVKPHGALYHATASATRRRPRPWSTRRTSTTRHSPMLGAAGLGVAAGRRRGRARGRRRGVRRPGVPRRRPPGAAQRARQRAHRPGHRRSAGRASATDHQVVAVDGTVVEVDARSICIHGDTPGAVQLARAVRAGLEVAGVAIQPFTS